MKKLVKENLNEAKDYSQLLNLKPKQSKHDTSQFSLKLPNGDVAVAMGDEFNPDAYGLELNDMLKYIDLGIEKFLTSRSEEFDYEELGCYADFFQTEFNDDDGFGVAETLTKEYVIGKMLCGKESAKTF